MCDFTGYYARRVDIDSGIIQENTRPECSRGSFFQKKVAKLQIEKKQINSEPYVDIQTCSCVNLLTSFASSVVFIDACDKKGREEDEPSYLRAICREKTARSEKEDKLDF